VSCLFLRLNRERPRAAAKSDGVKEFAGALAL